MNAQEEQTISDVKIQAERKLVSSVVVSPESVNNVWEIEAKHFDDKVNAKVFEAVKLMVSEKREVDITSLLAELKGEVDISLLSEYMLEEFSLKAMLEYSAILQEECTKAELRRALDKARKAVDKGKPREVIAEAQKELIEVSGGVRSSCLTLDELRRQHLKRILEDIKSDTDRILTGFERLDKMFLNLRRGTLTVVGAKTSYGKTSLSLDLAKKVAENGTPVLYVACEMNEIELYKRIIYPVAGLDIYELDAIRKDPERLKVTTDFVKGAAEHFKKTPLSLWVEPNLNIDIIRAVVRSEAKKRKLGLVIVDYIQLLQGSRRESREQEVGSIAMGMKHMSVESDVAVLAPSQLSRKQDEDERPLLSALRESGQIEQHADNVIFLYADGKCSTSVETADGNKAREVKLYIAKQRSGAWGKEVKLWFIPSLTTFLEPEKPAKQREQRPQEPPEDGVGEGEKPRRPY